MAPSTKEGAICMGTNLDDEETPWGTVKHPSGGLKHPLLNPFLGGQKWPKSPLKVTFYAHFPKSHIPLLRLTAHIALGTMAVIHNDEWVNEGE